MFIKGLTLLAITTLPVCFAGYNMTQAEIAQLRANEMYGADNTVINAADRLAEQRVRIQKYTEFTKSLLQQLNMDEEYYLAENSIHEYGFKINSKYFRDSDIDLNIFVDHKLNSSICEIARPTYMDFVTTTCFDGEAYDVKRHKIDGIFNDFNKLLGFDQNEDD